MRKPEDFAERRKLVEYTTLKTAGSFGRPPDLAPLIAVGLYARKPLFKNSGMKNSGMNVDFAENIDRYLEYGRRNIRVNAICPGPIATPLLERIAGNQKAKNVTVETMAANTPLGRPGASEEIAKVALFLASDESSYASGASFAIDGGMLAS